MRLHFNDATSANYLYEHVLRTFVQRDGLIRSAPRGMPITEALNVSLTLTDPSKNLVTLPGRQLNYAFAVAEWLWILNGSNDASIIMGYNKNLGFSLDDDAYRFSGAYGPKVIEQLDYVRRVLTDDPDSRQAVMTIWRERPRTTKDVPCTLSFQFFIRDERLVMITNMRSNDIILGLPYDLFSFTQIQRCLAHDLGVGVGEYHHHVGSMHLYDRDEEIVRRTLMLESLGDVTTPAVPTSEDRRKLFTVAQLFEYDADHAISTMNDYIKRGIISAAAAPFARVLATRWNKKASRDIWPWVSQ